MISMKATTLLTYISITLCVTLAATVVSDVTSIGHAVADLEKTVSFYHDVLGLQVLFQDATPKSDPSYGQLTATTSATYRKAIIAIPNQTWTLNLIQYYGLELPGTSNQWEANPATPALTLTCKNATAVNNALRAANVTTIDGDPIPVGTGPGTTSTVWVYDPDGYMVEAVQRSGPSDYFSVSPPNITDGPGMQYVIRGQLDLTLRNITSAMTFYGNTLGQNINPGFEPLIGPGYAEIGFLGGLFGISSNVKWAATTGNCNPTTRCEYYEYDDPSRSSFIYPVQTVGVGMTTYVVGDLDTILAQVTQANLEIVTEGKVPVTIDGMRSILIRDPSGYLVRLDGE
jgi:catechol 2,3-dioxygenase-like lactoylglutathione lyase family enzyme